LILGGRKMQFRLVKPTAKSLNNNDSYVLAMPNKIIVWNGKKSSIMKRAKAAELATAINKKKEYGCSCRFIQTIEHFGNKISKTFLAHFSENECDVEDQYNLKDCEFEDSIIKKNLVYQIETCSDNSNNIKLIFNPQFSGRVLKKRNLDPSKVIIIINYFFLAYVFDFGTEVYLWLGSKYNRREQKNENELALNCFDQTDCEYLKDYLDSINQLHPYGYYFPIDKKNRPDWVTIEKIKEKCESILFKKKFSDWNDIDIKISAQKKLPESKMSRNKINFNGCFKKDPTYPYILLGTVINRGKGGFDPDLDFNFSIFEDTATVHRLVKNEFQPATDNLFSFLFSEEAYLIEWSFTYGRKDIRNIKRDSENENTGREISVYFYWQGRDCSVSEKALSAVLTIFHVKKKAHQCHIGQDQELPVFLYLFKGNYISSMGKLKSFDQNENHLYLIRGENKESFLTEVIPSYQSLRSQAQFLFVVAKTKKIYNWVGSNANKHLDVRNYIKNLCKLFEKNETYFDLEVIEENQESACFKDALFFPENIAVTEIRIFRVICLAIVMVCTFTKTYLWLGWKHIQRDTTDDKTIISEHNVLKDPNFLEMKQFIIEDAIPFLKEHNFCCKITEIHSGIEPYDFITLFPMWIIRNDVREIQNTIGRIPNSVNEITENIICEQYLRLYYPLHVLSKRPLPENVKHSQLEIYLEDSEFEGTHMPNYKKLSLPQGNAL
ncbi:hypothetical protein HZS_5717, partial [Henneguya salminicola]